MKLVVANSVLDTTAPIVFADKLLQAAASMTNLDADYLESAASSLLAVPDMRRFYSGISELNFNGSPLQLLYTVRKNRQAVRLLADPGFTNSDPVARYSAGNKALKALLEFVTVAELAPAQSLASLAQQTLKQIVPANQNKLTNYAAGVMWLALALNTPGISLYVAPEPGSNRWQVAKQWLATISPAPEAALRLISILQHDCFLLGVGIEGANVNTTRVKLYWRINSAMALSCLGLPLFTDPLMVRFLSQALGDQTVDAAALNFSANFDLQTGKLRDVKVDISWHNRHRDDALQLLYEYAVQLGFWSSTVARNVTVIKQLGLGIGCIGLGLDTTENYRLNSYFYQAR